jgi:predicted MFS family arabinose efflux permease
VMLTASVNVVQSAWPEEVQGDISGVSRSVSNLGSSLGVAIAGSVLVGAAANGNPPFVTALCVVGGFAIVGWVAALLLPRTPAPEAQT